MEEFEIHITSEDRLKLWLYVDNTFIIWTQEKLKKFLEHLNNKHPKNKFTMTIEHDNQQPFFDPTIMKKEFSFSKK